LSKDQFEVGTSRSDFYKNSKVRQL